MEAGCQQRVLEVQQFRGQVNLQLMPNCIGDILGCHTGTRTVPPDGLYDTRTRRVDIERQPVQHQ